jgi:hypothetical protein
MTRRITEVTQAADNRVFGLLPLRKNQAWAAVTVVSSVDFLSSESGFFIV